MANRKQSTFERLSSGHLNRQQRRELARKLTAEHPGLEIVNRNVGGIDVGNESHYVAVAPGCDQQPVREFGSWTADLERMASDCQALYAGPTQADDPARRRAKKLSSTMLRRQCV